MKDLAEEILNLIEDKRSEENTYHVLNNNQELMKIEEGLNKYSEEDTARYSILVSKLSYKEGFKDGLKFIVNILKEGGLNEGL